MGFLRSFLPSGFSEKSRYLGFFRVSGFYSRDSGFSESRDFREFPGFANFYLRDIPGFLAPESGFLFMEWDIPKKAISRYFK